MNESRSFRVSTRHVLVGLLGFSLVVACFVSLAAASTPDGLEYVAEQAGFGHTATESPLATGPFADYAVAGIDLPLLSQLIVGALGCAATFLAGWGLAAVVKRVRRPSSAR